MEEFEEKFSDYVLYVENLSVVYTLKGKSVYALTDVTFGIRESEAIGIVGESGCGKSTLAMAISHILSQNTKVTSGRIYYRGKVIVDMESGASFTLRENSKSRKVEQKLKVIRWNGISIIFQGALDSLNPLLRIGEQISDIFVYKAGMTRDQAKERSRELLAGVGLDLWIMDAFPHQLSGGMKQRVIIAMAIALKPSLIIADEPTTSLDVITQYRIVEEINRLRSVFKLSIINISHDISLISHISDRIMIMYAGRIIEKLPSNNFGGSRHPYTHMLVESLPKLDREVSVISPIRGAPPSLVRIIQGCPFYERCDYHQDRCMEVGASDLKVIDTDHEAACVVLPAMEGMGRIVEGPAYINSENMPSNAEVITIENVSKIFTKKAGIREISTSKKSEIVALDNVSLTVHQGETVALVGETGSGKTTLSRILGLLETPSSGTIKIMGDPVDFHDGKQLKRLRTTVQTIFQDPFQSINPRFSVRKAISEPLIINKLYPDQKEFTDVITSALIDAELTPVEDYMEKYPHELSGGQRQRVSIARALVTKPKILIADEPISMLDVSLRAGILNFMNKIVTSMGLTLFYITHDIASARYVSKKIYVLYRGTIVEGGSTEDLIRYSAHPYTIALVLSSMGLSGLASETLGEKIFEATEQDQYPKCKFAPRCPLAVEKCFTQEPDALDLGGNHYVKCHFAGDIYNYTRKVGISNGLNMADLKKKVGAV
ncbi:MAG: hypothetical protein B2I17_06375 [Thermoplasmatales archaeon B_DKE]|nr:MAG: hypothetical protein B2I17_06375 [Thermoplasmatales archaeon B_DKE]